MVQREPVTLLPAGMELVAMAIAACLLMIDPTVAEPACAGGICSRAWPARSDSAIVRIHGGIWIFFRRLVKTFAISLELVCAHGDG